MKKEKTYLERAIEIEDNLICLDSQIHISKSNKWKCDKVIVMKKKFKKKAKNLIKEIKEKGCGKEFPICWNWDEWLEIECGSEFSGKKRLCDSCKKAIKLCEEVLE